MDYKDISIYDGLDANEALHILINHFMGENYYTINCSPPQSNAEAVRDIISRYPSGKIRKIHKDKRSGKNEYI